MVLSLSLSHSVCLSLSLMLGTRVCMHGADTEFEDEAKVQMELIRRIMSNISGTIPSIDFTTLDAGFLLCVCVCVFPLLYL